MEREAEAIFEEIAAVGGVVRGIEQGWFQLRIHQSAMRFQHEVEQRRRLIVGVNAFEDTDEAELEILKVTEEPGAVQQARLAELRDNRDSSRVDRCLAELRAAADGRNVIPAMLECARSYCTLYEIRHVLEEVYGAYREPVFF
jgi:methylmalonyl-CoA mutase N-terminal domain/subunit